MRYPWQEDDWRRIVREFDSLPNAWLLTGPEGIGKVDFAYSLARALLCDTPLEDGRGCGQCESCRWLASGTHPDFRHLCPEAADEGKEEGGKSARKLSQIKIEAVREIIEFSQLTAHRHGRRVVLVEPAEKLNLSAANAILKVLEEPPDNTVFLLVADRPQRLLPTIRSRCRKFSLSRPPHEVALAWLKTQGVAHAEAELAWHGGAPVFEHDEALYRLRAQFLSALKTPTLVGVLAAAEEVDRHKLPLAQPLEWLAKWLADIAAQRLAHRVRYHPDEADAVALLARRANLAALMRCQDGLTRLVPFGQHTLNVRLQLEALLMEYLKVFA